MKITLIKTRANKEVITRYSLEQIAYAIQTGWRKHNVTYLREVYHLMNKERQPDGQIETNWEGGIKLERICFAQEFDKYKEQRRILGYNGLVVVEVNNLATYEKAVEVRDAAKKMPETLMCFLGASGKSVKIVCRGELFEKDQTTPPKGTPPTQEGNKLPTAEEEIRQFEIMTQHSVDDELPFQTVGTFNGASWHQPVALAGDVNGLRLSMFLRVGIERTGFRIKAHLRVGTHIDRPVETRLQILNLKPELVYIRPSGRLIEVLMELLDILLCLR